MLDTIWSINVIWINPQYIISVLINFSLDQHDALTSVVISRFLELWSWVDIINKKTKQKTKQNKKHKTKMFCYLKTTIAFSPPPNHGDGMVVMSMFIILLLFINLNMCR